MSIKKLLIANRGEIAVRIIRACKEMGIETVAIYSTADEEALHVLLADEAVCVGSHQVKNSYLHMENIISAAVLTGCNAIHPGFGFLSENPKFARLVQEYGLIFVGPSAHVIEQMGNKATARALMIKAGVPVVPGSGVLEDLAQAREAARRIGYPVLIKASSGGGGRGMRIVEQEAELEAQLSAAKAEAKVAFGDDQVYLEKLIVNPKHVEVQIIADQFGQVLHAYERDCSLQRRNQKIAEEAPCHSLSAEVKQQLYQDAVKAANFVCYDSLGTIEFVVDQNQQYYFIEMNTRIQVEHPVTEMITNLDLIKLQLKIASHIPLSIKQEDIKITGHAMECRINAEDVDQDFAPASGTVSFLHFPGGKGVRVDSALYQGYSIPPFYDSMLAKLIVCAPSRLECIKKMRAALEELMIDGVKTNLEFQYLLLHQGVVVDGKYTTKTIAALVEEMKANAELV